MSSYLIENNKVEIQGEYDVIVIGGGVAGAAAALSARRNGCKTLIVEKSVMLGGLATLGMVIVYLPLCDGNGKKVIGGIAEEFLHLSIKYGYGNLSEEWLNPDNYSEKKKRYYTIFNYPAFVLALDEIMIKENVDLLFDTVFSAPIMEDGFCKGVIVENKAGRIGYKAQVIIDTTGDCDVMHRAGAECCKADNNSGSLWGYDADLTSMKEAIESDSIMKTVRLMKYKGTETFSGTDPKDVTQFILYGRKLALEGLKQKKTNEYSIFALPGMAQFRKTRRIKGYYELTENDVNKHFDDSIGCTGDWRKAGPVYEIPYRTLIAKGIKNVITAGRTISSDGDAWEITRVIPPAALTGQAAGLAAALAVSKGLDIDKVPVDILQKKLSEAGVIIHF